MKAKKCYKCGCLQPIENFHINKALKEGVDNKCKDCKKIEFKKWYDEKHPPKIKVPLTEDEILAKKEYIKQWKRDHYQKNKEEIATKSKEYYRNNSQLKIEYAKKYAAENQEKIKLAKKEYNLKNKEKISEKRRIKAAKNSEKHKKYLKIHKKEKAHLYNGYNAKRRALKKGQIHPDNNRDFEKIIYKISSRVSKCLGITHNVDHIIPISSGGPHHHANLQVIPEFLNLSKKDDMDYQHPSLKTWRDIPEHLVVWSKSQKFLG